MNVLKEIKHIVSTLKLNGYPQPLLSKHISLSSDKECRSDTSEGTQWRSTAVIPYVRGVSESIRRILAKLQIRVCYRPLTNLRGIFPSPKDRPSDSDMSSVVYKIPCASCSASYIGQTRRRLSQRITEHKRAVSHADFTNSALAEHACQLTGRMFRCFSMLEMTLLG